MSFIAFSIMVCVGLCAGLLTSAVGLGASLVAVPSLLLILPLLNIPDGVTPVMALGTAMAVSLFTASFTAYSHVKAGNLRQPLSPQNLGVMACAGLGATLGAVSASAVPAKAILAVVAAAQLVVGILLLLRRRGAADIGDEQFAGQGGNEEVKRVEPISRDEEFVVSALQPAMAAAAEVPVATGLGPLQADTVVTVGDSRMGRSAMPVLSGIGFLTSIGAGGSLIAPYLALTGMAHRQLVGLASLLSVLIGACAVVVYSAHAAVGVQGAVGAVHLPAALAICAGAFLAVRYGVGVAARIDHTLLQRILGFALLASVARICLSF